MLGILYSEYYMYASAFATPLRLVYGTFYLAIVTGLPAFLRVHQGLSTCRPGNTFQGFVEEFSINLHFCPSMIPPNNNSPIIPERQVSGVRIRGHGGRNRWQGPVGWCRPGCRGFLKWRRRRPRGPGAHIFYQRVFCVWEGEA